MTNFKGFCALLAAIALAGCAQPYPEIEAGFESNWQSQDYQADVYLIPDSNEAIARRVQLVRNAKSSVDMTYFSWEKDTLGLMLFNELKHAADRGVHVRLTLDDLLVFNDKWLSEISTHENIEVKIFNPFNSRKMGWIGRAGDFLSNQKDLDNRLHEKYFNVDHQYMILGGRNIGDDYFGYSKQANFFDMDVLFKGEVIEAFHLNYESLWNSEHLVPMQDLVKSKDGAFDKALKKAKLDESDIVKRVERKVAQLAEPEFIHTEATPVFDSIEKLNDNKPYFRTRAEQTVENELSKANEVIISTPYVVPHDGEFHVIDRLREQGSNVTLLTNSSASNDSGFIPAYYEKHRQTLLNKGVNIYEYRDSAKNKDHYFHVDTYYHNKTLIIDNKLTFIGSSNFDPRSDFLNIEFGLFVQSEEFAKQVEAYLSVKRSSFSGVFLIMNKVIPSGKVEMRFEPKILTTVAGINFLIASLER
ncbi:cardiolipin synthetase [Vibrio ishigakensis]|uniref:Cardiolipin synthetase n=1 Tax=Vibrio ishigakensis TaxID=1481914 RepID=A0A0B8NWP1_9VIBR|nr:cardiolipin synthetase [Vibrio ishigakensis]